jgi:glycosyltransferase involved in cell wall biosynthesis
MAQETNLYTSKSIEVTPFGIDLDFFEPQSITSMFNEKDILIGTVKSLEETYGVEYLVRAFAILKKRYEKIPLKLLLVGGGSQESYLKNLVKELEIENSTVFTGKVYHDEVVLYHNMLSVFVAVSNRESFGVAVIEASACEKPVVVSRIGGLLEVVEDGVTGFIVEPRNPEQTALAIEKLIVNEPLRHQMGHAGRERVKNLFNWQDNVEQMISIYRRVLS